MIVAVLGTKGGTGKSTLATNLAVLLRERGDVLLLDADRQGSSAGWSAIREEADAGLPSIPCVQRFGNLRAALPDLEERYGVVVVDCGGRDGEEGRSALLLADVAIVPLLPSQFDLWAMEDLVKMLEATRVYRDDLRAFAVFNRAPYHPAVRAVAEAREYLDDQGIELADAVVRERRAFQRAAAEGRSVIELSPRDPKASTELRAIFDEIIGTEEESHGIQEEAPKALAS